MMYLVYDESIARDILAELIATEDEIKYIREELKKLKCGCSKQAKLLQNDLKQLIAYYNYLDTLPVYLMNRIKS